MVCLLGRERGTAMTFRVVQWSVGSVGQQALRASSAAATSTSLACIPMEKLASGGTPGNSPDLKSKPGYGPPRTSMRFSTCVPTALSLLR